MALPRYSACRFTLNLMIKVTIQRSQSWDKNLLFLLWMYVAILHVLVCFLSLVQYNFQLSLGDAGERMFVVVREFSSDLQWRRSSKSTIVK